MNKQLLEIVYLLVIFIFLFICINSFKNIFQLRKIGNNVLKQLCVLFCRHKIEIQPSL